MPPVRTEEARRQRAALIVANASIVMIVLATIVTLSLGFDERLASAAEALPPDAVVWGQRLSDLGRFGYLFAISGALAVGAAALRAGRPHDRIWIALTLVAERATFVFAVLAASGMAAQAIKHVVGRARPRTLPSSGAYHFDGPSLSHAFAGFPSGHSTTAFAMAMAMGLLYPRLRVPFFVLAVAIAASRIVVQAHYLSDVLAGAVLGGVSAHVVASAFGRRGIVFDRTGDRLRLKSAVSMASRTQ